MRLPPTSTSPGRTRGAGFHALWLVSVLTALAAAQEPGECPPAAWPQWRGPLATGVAPHADPPVEWSATRNVRWRVLLPGRGHATPIIWGERIYVQTAVPADLSPDSRPAASTSPTTAESTGRTYKFTLLALDRQTGQTVWAQTLCEGGLHERGHNDASPASNSPLTDGECLIAYFGSRGLYGLDLDGKLLWSQDLGDMETRRGFGEGSSPALHGDLVVVNWDHEGDSFIVALDKRTGAERWRVPRDEPTSWSTPHIVTAGGQVQVIVSATRKIRSYDLQTGRMLWECGGMTQNVIPTPVSDRDLIYCTSGFRGSALLAIRYAVAQGDIAGSAAVAWTYEGKGTPYVPSPLLYEGRLYFLQENRAALSCVDARTGRAEYSKQRLEGLRDVYASPVAANGRVYIAGRDGKVAVIQAGSELRVLAVNELADSFTASPAIVGRALYLRGAEHLYCIAEPEPK